MSSDNPMPPIEIRAPLLRVRPNGILVDVAHRLTEADLYNPGAPMDRVVGGITFCPQGCATLTPAENVWCDDLDAPDYSATGEGTAPIFSSFAVFGREDAPARFEQSLADGRVVNRFDTQISAQLATELLTGATTSNPSLQSSVTDEVTTAVDAGDALYVANEILAAVPNAVGTVFASPALLEQLAASNDLVADAGVFRTATGHYVVGDAGFDGSDPDGVKSDGESWLYVALGVPYVWLGERRKLGTDDANFDRSRNRRSTIYVQEGLVAFEPCLVGAIPVTVPSTAIGS